MANTPWRRASILLDVDAGVRHSESSTVPSAPGAGYGMFWVRDDATTVPMFTDSGGGDTVLGTGGAPDRIAQSGVITDSLQFFVDFNNQSSWEPNQTTTWVDTIASVSGTATATTITAGHLNFNGLAGSGTSVVDFGVIGATLAGAFAGGGTIMAWLRAESDGEGSNGRVFDAAAGNTKNFMVYAGEESGGAMKLHFWHAWTGVDLQWILTNADVTLNEWTHFAVTYNSDSTGNVPTFYINGEVAAAQVEFAPGGAADIDAAQTMYVGNRTANDRTWDGDIEVVGIYNGGKTATEIADIYNATKARFGVGGGANTNIYNADGTLDAARTVTMGSNPLTFAGTGLTTFAANVILSGTANKFLQNTPTVGYVPTATNADGSWTWQAGGSASTWTDVLTAGNISGGNNAVLSIGDSLIGVDSASTTVNSGDLVLRGGNKDAVTGAADPGNVTIDGGSSTSTSSSPGGNVIITSGNQIAASGGAAAGTLFLLGATPTNASGKGGGVTLQSGGGANIGNNAGGGDILIQSGDAALSDTGGSITIVGGTSGDAINNGGAISITAGANVGTGSGGNGGNLTMSAGDSVVEDGGDVFINGGDMTGATSAADTGGSITLTAGTGTTPNYNIGSLNLIVPSPASPSTENVASGNVNITAGHNGTRNNPGGAINLTAGDTYGGVPNDGGMIVMTPGTSLLGIDGRAKIAGTGTLEMIERTTALGFIAGSGYFWVRDDAPNVPMFTNDVGTDFVLTDNLYTADGTLSGARAVAFGSNAMTFSGAGEFIVNNTSKFLQDTPAIGEVATATGVDGSWTWQAAAGGTVELGLAVQATGTTNPALMDASFAWRITNGQALTFEATDGTDILAISAAGGGDSVTFMAGAGAIAVTDNNLLATGGVLTVGSSNDGSSVTVVTADSATSPGDLLLSPGDATGATSDNGGDVTITGGASTNGGGSGNGGTVSLQPGTSVGGVDGSLVLDYSTWPAADGTTGFVLSTDGAGALAWSSVPPSAWSEETATTTDATVGVTIATPIATVSDGTQHSVEVLITAEAGGANTYFRRQIFTYYRDGGGAVQWTQEINGAEARRGLAVTVVASLTAVGNAVLVNVTGQAATNIDWTVQYRTTNTIQNGGTIATTGIVRETFDNRSSAVTTGSATASGGTVDFTLAAGSAYVNLIFLRVTVASGTCADATIQFFSDVARTVEIYDAENKNTSLTNGWVDRNPSAMLGDDGSALASNIMYGRITNNDAGAATFDVEAVCWGVV